MKRYEATPGFNPFKRALPRRKAMDHSDDVTTDERKASGSRRKRAPQRDARFRRDLFDSRLKLLSISRVFLKIFVNFFRVDRVASKSPRRCFAHLDDVGQAMLGVDELSTVGHPSHVQVMHVFEPTGAH